MREVYVTGKNGSLACLEIREYEDGAITVSAEDDKITNAQLRKELRRLYSRHRFKVSRESGYVYAQALRLRPTAQENYDRNNTR